MKLLLLGVATVLICSACTTKPSVVRGDTEKVEDISYQHLENFAEQVPQCIAVMPTEAVDIGEPYKQLMRRAVVAQLAPKGYRDVEINEVDRLISSSQQKGYAELNQALQCDSYLVVDLERFGKVYMGVYSQWEAQAELRLYRADDGALLWRGRHQAVIRDGAIPFSPLSLLSGLYFATTNLDEEQGERVAHDFARRVLATLPDREIGSDDVIAKKMNVDTQLKQIHLALDQGDYEQALQLSREGLRAYPNNTSFQMEETRALTLTGQWQKAIEAANAGAELDADEAQWFDLMGYSYTQLNQLDDAFSAYQRAVQLNPNDAFAYFNLGRLSQQMGDVSESLGFYQKASELYVAAGDNERAKVILQTISQLRET